MKKELTNDLLQKYLSGAPMTGEEWRWIDETLRKDEQLCAEIWSGISTSVPDDFLLKGINYAGEQELKNKLLKTSGRLEQAGFFLGEDEIADYLSGELDESLLAVFEKRLAADPAFAQAVEKERRLSESIGRAGELALAGKIQNVQEKLEAEGFFDMPEAGRITPPARGKIVSLINRRKWLALAAAFALFVMTWFLYQNRNADPLQLYADYAQPFEDKISASIQSQLNSTGYAVDKTKLEALLAAMEPYNKKNYDGAVSKLSDYTARYPDDLMARFYFALSLQQQGEMERAQSYLLELSLNDNFLQKDAAKWYLALGYLQQDRISNCKEILTELQQGNSVFKDRAGKLLDKLP